MSRKLYNGGAPVKAPSDEKREQEAAEEARKAPVCPRCGASTTAVTVNFRTCDARCESPARPEPRPTVEIEWGWGTVDWADINEEAD
jgi:hypothetical protein